MPCTPRGGMHRQRQAKKPYEFGVKVSVAVTHKQGLMVGARILHGQPMRRPTLNEQLEQATIQDRDTGAKRKQVVVDLGSAGAWMRTTLFIQIIQRPGLKPTPMQPRTVRLTFTGFHMRRKSDSVGDPMFDQSRIELNGLEPRKLCESLRRLICVLEIVLENPSFLGFHGK